ncbi:sodium-dependent glucose transporter 1A-like [Dermatophagoides pteronyssinus]|uniref:sodium-dependent glucose transporter 1A-like n=1 Tax=Dermatophagoides pteronyssinus TaxID=6956 RepID=UPI003F6777CC
MPLQIQSNDNNDEENYQDFPNNNHTNIISQQRRQSLPNQSSLTSSSSTSWMLFEQQIDRKTLSIIYTISLYYSFIAVGLCASIFNPTLLQLSHVFGTDLQTVSVIFPLRAIGCTAGTLINGFLNTYFNRQILLVIFLILKALTTFLVPHWTNLKQFYVNAFFNGFFTAAVVVMVNVWMNEMWSWSSREQQNHVNAVDDDDENSMENNVRRNDEKSRTIIWANVTMQALHFFFGLGTILGPLIAEPFLNNPFNGFDDNFVANNLVWPYAISAILAITSSLSIFIMYIFIPYEQLKKKNIKSNESTMNLLVESEDQQLQQQQQRKKNLYRYSVITLAALFLAMYSFSEATYLQFSASFCSKVKLKLTQPQAALVSSSLAISFTAFRGVSAFVALKLTPIKMIIIDFIIIIIGNLLVFFMADTQIIGLIIGYILLGAGFSSVVPSLFPLLEQRGYTVTDWIGSIITFSGGVAQVLAPYIIGLWIDRIPYVLVDFTFLSIITATIMFTIMFLLMKFDQKRQQQQNQQHYHQ